MYVVNQEVGFGDAVFAESYHLRVCAVHANSLVSILTENHWLAMLEIEDLVLSHAPFGKIIESMIVEDVAVLIDLEERDTFVSGRGFDHHAQMLHIDIDGAGHEGRFAGDR